MSTSVLGRWSPTDGAEIGPGSVVGAGAVLGPGTVLGERCVIEDGAVLGKRPRLRAGSAPWERSKRYVSPTM